MNEIATITNQSVTVTDEQRELVRKTIAAEATENEFELFLYDNRRRGVHPLDRLIHFTKRKGKYVPITSIHFMRAKADEDGRAGQDKPVFTGTPMTTDYECSVTVYKMVNGEKVPYTGSARWKEYYPGDGELGFMWRKMETHMLAKCAEANALRLGFPRPLAGLNIEEEAHMFDRPEPRADVPMSTLKDKLKAQLQSEPDGAGASVGGEMPSPSADVPTQQASDAAPPFNPETCPPPTEEEVAFDLAVDEYTRKFRDVSTSAECNKLYQECPQSMKQAIYTTYSKAMKDLTKKAGGKK